MSLTPEIKMGVLLGRSFAGGQALAILAFAVVPSGLPLRGPNMSLDMRLAEKGRRDRPIQPGTLPLPRMVRVAGCRQQLVHP